MSDRALSRICMPNIAAMWVDLWAEAYEVPSAVVISSHFTQDSDLFVPDSRQAWLRLAVAVMIASVGAVGMWSVVVVMPVVQAEFAATRGAVSLAATMIFFGFGLGGVITGKITDRLGIVPAMAVSIAFLCGSYVLAGLATALWQFIIISFLMGLGTSATFAPLMAEASHWFERYRGLAVTIVASGNYIAGTFWPPLINWSTQAYGWRATHFAIAIVCGVLMTILRAFGIVSRIGSGFIAARFGGMVTLMIGSVAQAVALFFYLFFTSLPSLYLISAMFGLFQGGIVPSYAIIVRETMPANEAATRVGIVIFASVTGMSFGGWVSGVIFDMTGSYAAAFANGFAWNLLNIAIVLMLLLRSRQRLAMA